MQDLRLFLVEGGRRRLPRLFRRGWIGSRHRQLGPDQVLVRLQDVERAVVLENNRVTVENGLERSHLIRESLFKGQVKGVGQGFAVL